MANLRRKAQAFVAGESVPQMRGGTPVASYECGPVRAILARDPVSLNPLIRIPFALLVYPNDYNLPPKMYVIAEQTSVDAKMLAALPPEIREALKGSGESTPFLCAFTDEGKFNLGESKDLNSLEGFERRAIATMREALDLAGEVRVLNDIRRGGAFPETGKGSGCAVILCSAPLVGYGLYLASKLLVA